MNIITKWAAKNHVAIAESYVDIRTKLIKALPFIAALTLGLFAADAYAQAEEAFETVATNVALVVTLGLQVILAVVFLIVAWAVISKFNEARRGRADWGEVVVPFVVGAAVLVMIAYLADAGSTEAEAIGT